jgi:hypothetical protein
MVEDYFATKANPMDRAYYHQLDSFGNIYHPTALHENAGGATTKLGPRELGMSNNPFQHQLIALQAKIREGASSIEFQFPGKGKGSSQASTPESYGYEDREAMRQLAEYNDVRTSTHATFQMSGLAGFAGNQGFSKQAQHQNMEEVRRAVDFASQASTGGAIVVHTGEWQRSMSGQDWAKKDFGLIKRKDIDGTVQELPAFMAYPDEEKEEQVIVVDSKSGQLVGGLRKDWGVTRPKWLRAKDYKAKMNMDLAGTDVEGKPTSYNDDDFVDVLGRKIDISDPNQSFRRVPEFDATNTQFVTEQVSWQQLVDESKEYNKKHGTNYTPEVLYARLQIENQVAQAKGNSLFHARGYEEAKDQLRKLREAKEMAQKLNDSLPADEKWRMLRQQGFGGVLGEFVPSEYKPVTSIIDDQIAQAERNILYIQESSSAADVQAKDMLSRQDKLMSVEDYGLQQSGNALGELGVYAMEKSKMMLKNVKDKGGDASKYEKLYIAPENVFPNEYGSHPDELIKIVESGREQMAKRLVHQYGKSEEEAKKLAADHIKSTLDIGHLNMWKTHMTRKDGETEPQFNQRFEKWAMEKLEVMHKKGVLGHFHITDNLGFNDEHLTPGQGNAPVRAFVKKMEELGYKDFILEPGSFNAGTILGESWSYFGAMGFKHGAHGTFGQRFTNSHWAQAGSYAPPNYIFGAYVPSNEWTLWSGVQLE